MNSVCGQVTAYWNVFVELCGHSNINQNCDFWVLLQCVRTTTGSKLLVCYLYENAGNLSLPVAIQQCLLSCTTIKVILYVLSILRVNSTIWLSLEKNVLEYICVMKIFILYWRFLYYTMLQSYLLYNNELSKINLSPLLFNSSWEKEWRWDREEQ